MKPGMLAPQKTTMTTSASTLGLSLWTGTRTAAFRERPTFSGAGDLPGAPGGKGHLKGVALLMRMVAPVFLSSMLILYEKTVHLAIGVMRTCDKNPAEAGQETRPGKNRVGKDQRSGCGVMRR